MKIIIFIIYHSNISLINKYLCIILIILNQCVLIFYINQNKNKINLLTLSKNQRLIISDKINLNPYLYEELYEQLNKYTSYININNDTDKNKIYKYLEQIILGNIQFDKLIDNKYYKNLNLNQQIYFTNFFKIYIKKLIFNYI